MSFIIDESRKLVTDVIGILGSREKHKALLKMVLYDNTIYFKHLSKVERQEEAPRFLSPLESPLFSGKQPRTVSACR